MTATLKTLSIAAPSPSSTMMVSVSAVVVPQSSNVYSPSVSFHNILSSPKLQEDASSTSINNSNNNNNNNLVLQATSSFLSNLSTVVSRNTTNLTTTTMNNSSLSSSSSFVSSTSSLASLVQPDDIQPKVDESLPPPPVTVTVTCPKETKTLAESRSIQNNNDLDVVMVAQLSEKDDIFLLTESKCQQQIVDEERIKEEKENVEFVPTTKDFDDNSNSTEGSLDTNGSARRKRRRGEGQLLIDHLHGLDKSLADDIVNDIKNEAIASNDNHNTDLCDIQSVNSCDTTPKKSRVDSPAFHLRPRRSHRTSQHGYCSSGSSSPITYLSPVKKPKTPLKSPCKLINIYTQQLLNDTSRQLSKYLYQDDSLPGSVTLGLNQTGHNGIGKYHVKPSSVVLKEKKDDVVRESKWYKGSFVRSLDRSILRDVDVSVFAELVSPLKLASHNCYASNYISLQIDVVKPMRYAQLTNVEKCKVQCPYLELVTSDINDRFSLRHTKGIFDDSSLSVSPVKNLTVFLVGTYALKGSQFASKGAIINIVKFRTTKSSSSKEAPDTMEQPKPKARKVSENTKKRKLLESVLTTVKNEDDEEDVESSVQAKQHHYNFQIIVDSTSDSCFDPNNNTEVKDENVEQPLSENGDIICESALPKFDDIFNDSYSLAANKTAVRKQWVPLVSFSSKWRAPDDPEKLNETLYVEQPCVPKFESTSRTVKLT